MKKQLAILVVLLFSIVLDKAGSYVGFQVIASDKSTFCLDKITPTITPPELVGMSSEKLALIDSIAKDGIKKKAYPGCQVLIMKDGKTIYDNSFGTFTYDGSQKVKSTTIYDLASLSKTSGTLLAVMKLYDDGKIQLDEKASHYLTFLRGTNKENITIKELLFHESGLPGSLLFYRLAIEKNNTPPFLLAAKDSVHFVQLRSTTLKYKNSLVSKIPMNEFTIQVSDSIFLHQSFHTAAMQKIVEAPLSAKTYLYSCINFILLKEIVETINGMPMDLYLEKEFYQPMKLTNTSYLPLRYHSKEEIAPTMKNDFLRNGIIQGYVNDAAAAFLGGISGNAGLFSTAHDVAIIHQMLLNNGELDGRRYLSEPTCKLFTTITSISGRRGLGFDKPVPSKPTNNPCCNSAPSTVFGHTGYTGTCCWVDPTNKLIYVFLSNRTYPSDADNKLARMGIRTKIQEVIYRSIK